MIERGLEIHSYKEFLPFNLEEKWLKNKTNNVLKHFIDLSSKILIITFRILGEEKEFSGQLILIQEIKKVGNS